MKSREPRVEALIPARVRDGTRWDDVFILNLSCHGLLLRTRRPPQRGSYVEVRRGTQLIVARVVWAGGDRFGVRTQDQVPVEAMLAGKETPAPSSEAPALERRHAPRSMAERHEASRRVGRTLEFATFTMLALCSAGAAFSGIQQALAQPMTRIASALR
jgi:hypothetical protein